MNADDKGDNFAKFGLKSAISAMLRVDEFLGKDADYEYFQTGTVTNDTNTAADADPYNRPYYDSSNDATFPPKNTYGHGGYTAEDADLNQRTYNDGYDSRYGDRRYDNTAYDNDVDSEDTYPTSRRSRPTPTIQNHIDLTNLRSLVTALLHEDGFIDSTEYQRLKGNSGTNGDISVTELAEMFKQIFDEYNFGRFGNYDLNKPRDRDIVANKLAGAFSRSGMSANEAFEYLDGDDNGYIGQGGVQHALEDLLGLGRGGGTRPKPTPTAPDTDNDGSHTHGGGGLHTHGNGGTGDTGGTAPDVTDDVLNLTDEDPFSKEAFIDLFANGDGVIKGKFEETVLEMLLMNMGFSEAEAEDIVRDFIGMNANQVYDILDESLGGNFRQAMDEVIEDGGVSTAYGSKAV
jgi:hypothetical protein